MNISAGLALKIAGSVFATVSASLGTYWLAFGGALTIWDQNLIERINTIKESESMSVTENNTTLSIGEGGNKLQISVSSNSPNNSHTFRFKPPIDIENNKNRGMDLWECIISGRELENVINKIKEKMGVKEGVGSLTLEHKKSMVNLISYCSLRGTPWRPNDLTASPVENKLSRTIEIKDERGKRNILNKMNIK